MINYITVPCEHCNQMLVIPTRHMGNVEKCPCCNKYFYIKKNKKEGEE